MAAPFQVTVVPGTKFDPLMFRRNAKPSPDATAGENPVITGFEGLLTVRKMFGAFGSCDPPFGFRTPTTIWFVNVLNRSMSEAVINTLS
jgi:hypothetical protein